MRLITTTHLASAALAIALALPAAAWAQSSTPSAAPAPAMKSTDSQQQKVEQRIADMYATLKITKAQDAEWNKFAQVMLDNAQSMDMLINKNRSDMAAASAEQALQNYSAIAEQHAQNVQKLLPAFHTLYASLTADQRKEADEMFRARAEERDQKQGAAQPAPMATQKQGG